MCSQPVRWIDVRDSYVNPSGVRPQLAWFLLLCPRGSGNPHVTAARNTPRARPAFLGGRDGRRDGTRVRFAVRRRHDDPSAPGGKRKGSTAMPRIRPRPAPPPRAPAAAKVYDHARTLRVPHTFRTVVVVTHSSHMSHSLAPPDTRQTADTNDHRGIGRATTNGWETGEVGKKRFRRQTLNSSIAYALDKARARR
jgi:hypothetical protein